jgi:hypothetical protein
MPHLGDRLYRVLKYLAQIALPAAATLYLAVAMIWGIPKAQEVVATITAVDTFLGVLLGLSTKAHRSKQYDGIIKVEESENKKTFSLVMHDDPQDLDKKGEATFKVIK